MRKQDDNNERERIEVKTTSNGGLFVDTSVLLKSQSAREEIKRLEQWQTKHEQRQTEQRPTQQT